MGPHTLCERIVISASGKPLQAAYAKQADSRTHFSFCNYVVRSGIHI